MFNPIRNFGSADDVLKRAEKRQQEEEERRKRAAGPALPSGSPTLKNVVSANSKEALYVRKDDDLTPDQIIRKYQFVADDTSMDYDRKRKMIKEGQKSLSRIRDRESFQCVYRNKGQTENGFLKYFLRFFRSRAMLVQTVC